MATGVNVSKTNSYAVLAPPDGVSISQANLYAVLSVEDVINISKAVAYAVITPGSDEVAQPMMFVTT